MLKICWILSEVYMCIASGNIGMLSNRGSKHITSETSSLRYFFLSTMQEVVVCFWSVVCSVNCAVLRWFTFGLIQRHFQPPYHLTLSVFVCVLVCLFETVVYIMRYLADHWYNKL